MAVNKVLLNTVETYRLGYMTDVEDFHKELQEDTRFDIGSFAYATKVDKKTEDEYYVVKVKKIFNEEKNITTRYVPDYKEPEFKAEF